MDLAHICEIFDGAPFIDNYFCNLTAAEERIAHYEKMVGSNGTDKEAAVCLLKAILLSLKNEHIAATHHIASLYSTDNRYGLRWCFRAQTYQFLLLSVIICPPFFRYLFRIESIQDTFLEVSLNIDGRIRDAKQRADPIKEQCSEEDRAEHDLMYGILQACKFRQEYAGFRSLDSSPVDTTKRETTLTSLNDILEPLQRLGERMRKKIPSMTLYIDRVIRELRAYFSEDMPHAPTEREQLGGKQGVHQTTTVDPNSGIDKMLDGDIACSTSSHVTSLNLILATKFSVNLDASWDAIEGLSQVRDVSRALFCYKEALEYFQAANNARGVACIYLRQGCFKYGFEAVRNQNAATIFDEAGALFKKASKLFEQSGDLYGNQLVKVHQLLLQIVLRKCPIDLQHGVAIATREVARGNMKFTQALALLILRFGHLQWRRYRASGVALDCLKLGFTFLSALGDKMTQVQTEITVGDILAYDNCHSQARTHLEAAYEIFSTQVLSYIRQVRKSVLSPFLRSIELAAPNLIFEMAERIWYSSFNLHDSATIRSLFTKILDLLTREFPSMQRTMFIGNYESVVNNYIFRIQYRIQIRKDNSQGAQMLLNNYLAQDTMQTLNPLGEKIAHLNAAFNYGRMEVAREILQELDDSRLFRASKADARVARTAFNSCINSHDYPRARKYFDDVALTHPGLFNIETPGDTGKDWEQLLNAAIMFQGLGEHQKSLRYLVYCCDLADRHRNDADDSQTKSARFGHSDVAKAFSWATNVCFVLGKQARCPSPAEFDCTPRLEESTWAEQAFFFTEKAKGRELKDSLTKRMRPIEKGDRVDDNFLQEPEWVSPDSVTHAGQALPKVPQLLQQVVEKDTMIVEYLLSHEGLAIFCVSHEGIQYSQWHDNFTIWTAQDLVSTYHQAIQEHRKEADVSRLDRVVRALSEALIQPVATCLKQIQNVIFVPSQSLARVPFSALLLEDEPLISCKFISQVPSIGVYQNLQASAKSRPKKDLVFSVVTNPKSTVSEGGTREQDIPWAGVEALYLGDRFRASPPPVIASKIAEEDFKHLYQKANLLLVSTHGYMEHESPWLSRITLRKPLFLRDLERVDTTADVVIFSACFSGLGHRTFSDDVIGFSNTILGSGASAFVGSLWPHSDMAGFFMTYFFAQHILNTDKKSDKGHESNITFSHAFSLAIKDLRNLSKEQAADIIAEMIKVYDNPREDVNPRKFIPKGRSFLEKWELLLRRFSFDFNHPFFWAPFVFIGYGSQIPPER